MPSTKASLNWDPHCVRFQLLKPICGVRARPLSRASAGVAAVAPSTPDPISAAAAASAVSTVLRTFVPPACRLRTRARRRRRAGQNVGGPDREHKDPRAICLLSPADTEAPTRPVGLLSGSYHGSERTDRTGEAVNAHGDAPRSLCGQTRRYYTFELV